MGFFFFLMFPWFCESFIFQVFVDVLGYKESHHLMDGRLVICTIAVFFAMFALVWDYLYPFPESRSILMICVISYPFYFEEIAIYILI